MGVKKWVEWSLNYFGCMPTGKNAIITVAVSTVTKGGNDNVLIDGESLSLARAIRVFIKYCIIYLCNTGSILC